MNNILPLIIIIIFTILIPSYIQHLRYKRNLRKLNNSRPHLSRTEYINQLVQSGFDKYHVEVVYDQIRDFIQLDDFSIYPEDDIHKIYRIDDLDDIALVDQICEKLNLRKAEEKDCDILNKEMEIFNAIYILTLTKKLAE